MTSYIKLFWNWVLLSLGIWQKKAKIILIGLDNSGKTTLLHLLKNHKLSCHEPTIHPTSENVQISNILFTVFDLGGHTAARRIWRNYTYGIDCIIFVIDACDIERIDEVKKELSSFLANENLQNIPVLILGNKIDTQPHIGKKQLEEILLIDPNDENIKIFMCSLFLRINIEESFNWLSTKLT